MCRARGKPQLNTLDCIALSMVLSFSTQDMIMMMASTSIFVPGFSPSLVNSDFQLDTCGHLELITQFFLALFVAKCGQVTRF